jgi:diacylglycerol kinase
MSVPDALLLRRVSQTAAPNKGRSNRNHQGCANSNMITGVRRYILNRWRSFGFAFKGLKTLVVTQPHARIHLVAIGVVALAGYFTRLSAVEWAVLVVCMALVLALEAVNTALELLTDLVSPEYHPLAGKAKDVAAAAVLIAAIGAIVVALLIFGPHWWPNGGTSNH